MTVLTRLLLNGVSERDGDDCTVETLAVAAAGAGRIGIGGSSAQPMAGRIGVRFGDGAGGAIPAGSDRCALDAPPAGNAVTRRGIQVALC